MNFQTYVKSRPVSDDPEGCFAGDVLSAMFNSADESLQFPDLDSVNKFLWTIGAGKTVFEGAQNVWAEFQAGGDLRGKAEDLRRGAERRTGDVAGGWLFHVR